MTSHESRRGRSAAAVVRGVLLACALLACGVSLRAENADDAPATPLPPSMALAEQALARVVAAEIPPVLVLAQLTSAQYGGAVSMAMEGARILFGEMTEDEERRFEARWKPLFRHPSEDVIAYLNRLNPVLAQFLALRAALNEVIEALDAAGLEALAAGELGDAAGVVQAMEGQRLYAALYASLEARLAEVAEAIRALGEPPNADEARRRARALHEAAFAPEPSMLRIVPEALVAAPLRPYEFRAVVEGAPEGARLQLDWRFSDGETRRTPVEQAVSRKFFLDPLKPEQALEVLLLDVGSNRVLARARVRIDVRAAAGAWVVVDRRVETDPSTQGPRFRGSRLNRDTGVREPIAEPPANVFDGRATVGDLEATTGWGNVAGTEEAAFRHLWDAPPPRLTPRETLRYAVRVEGADATLGVPEAPEGSTLAAWTFLPWGPKQSPKDLGAASARARCATRKAPVDPAERRGEGVATFEIPLPYVVGPDRKPIDPTGQAIELRVRGRSTYLRCTPSVSVTYRYAWDPTGSSVAPLGAGGGGPGATSAAAPEEDATTRARRLAREQTEFHEANARWFEGRVRESERALAAATDPEARNRTARDLLYQLDALQRERDAIASIATGEFVRTRTALDAFNMKVMAEESRELAETWHTVRRTIERGPVLVEMAPPEDRDRLRRFFYEHVTSDAVASGDPERLRRVTSSIADRVLGGLAQQAAEAEEAGVTAAEWDEWIHEVKDAADVSMMALSFVGGGSVYMVYEGATGYVEGGLSEGVRRTASGYHAITTIVNAGMEGYQRGVRENLEAYAADPGKVRIDEAGAGWQGAAWDAGKAAALMAAMKLGHAALGGGGCPSSERAALAAKRQDARVRHFRARQGEAAAKVAGFQQRARALAAAGRAQAPKEILLRLRADLEGSYRDVKTDYFAKMRMNALGRAGDTKTLHAYRSVDRAHMKRVTAALDRRMTQAGYGAQRYRSFSNSASKGKVGMDVDIGAVEPPRYVTRAGARVRNPEHVAWTRSITQRLPDRSVVRRSPTEFAEAGQHELEAAFQEVFGRRPGEAMVAFTTTYHPEAYRDVAWLGKKGSKTALVHETDPGWVQQAADVTRFKVNHLPREFPGLGHYGHLQERCRGLVKDFDTKLAPMLASTRNPQARRHLEELRSVMNRFAVDDLGPVEAEHRLRLLTGGEGVTGVLDRFTVMLRGSRAMLPK